MRKSWWKVLCVILLGYTIIGGFLLSVPRLNIVNETVRALYFHVPMWFGMIALFLASMIYAIRYLRNNNPQDDIYSSQLANVGIIFGLLGIFTGMIWANYAWGTPWHGDAKQNGAAVATLAYLIYFVLRGALSSDEQRARFSAVYNIFAFAAMIPLIFIYPRMVDSLHPGSGGNPGFNMYDLDSKMRMVFYPACIGWILLGFWIATIRIRTRVIEETILDQENE